MPALEVLVQHDGYRGQVDEGRDGSGESLGLEEWWVDAESECLDLVDGVVGLGDHLGQKVGDPVDPLVAGVVLGGHQLGSKRGDLLPGPLVEMLFEPAPFLVLGADQAPS